MNKIPCPPAPKYGYNLLYDHQNNTWVFIKQKSKPVQEIIVPFKL
jgi:hypothetical protein